MEDPDFANKYPKITEMAKWQIGKNDKTKAKNTKKMFLESLTKCKTFSQETLALLQLVEGLG